jgi:ABC-type transport system involved in multi-copper enzyme maturation permease subunit
MTLPDHVRTARWMVRDTFRQSVASKLFWVLLALTFVATGLGASVRVDGDVAPIQDDADLPAVVPPEFLIRVGLEKLKADGEIPDVPKDLSAVPPEVRARAEEIGRKKAEIDGTRPVTGTASFGFGAVTAKVGRDRSDTVRFVQLWLAAFVADTAGVLLALLWTAGFLPTFLDPQAVTVLLAKPAPRWAVLLGKYLGVVLFVALHATIFVTCTWTVMGLRTGVWPIAYWLAVPLLVVNFAVFYAVSAFLAVWTRSTVASGFGVLLFWLVCWAANYTHLRLATGGAEGLGAGALFLFDVGYWVLPKPLDLGGIFYDAMGGSEFSAPIPEVARMKEAGRLHPELSVLTAGAFAVVTLGLAAFEFEQTDY